MDDKRAVLTTRRCSVSRSPLAGANEDDLLGLYLSSRKGVREEKFASTAQAAENVGLSQRTIQSWIDSGRIQSVRVGRKRRVYLKSLVDYLKQRNEQ